MSARMQFVPWYGDAGPFVAPRVGVYPLAAPPPPKAPIRVPPPVSFSE